ncbi:MAG: peptidoglycan DD-metalloendopeptidase family protein [Anaerolineaceae bacterium]
MIYKKILVCLIILFLISPASPANAQAPTDNPVYIVQNGDTLTQIAIEFGITLNALIEANNINDPNAITVGTSLIIPGFEGISGVLTPENAQLGETFRSILLKHQIDETLFVRLNHITSPDEIYAGSSVIVPENEQAATFSPLGSLDDSETLLDMAVKTNSNPWTLVERNNWQAIWDVIPGEMVFGNADQTQTDINPISPFISTVEITPLPLIQGETTEIKITTRQPINLSGTLTGQQLHFFQNKENEYVAFQGIYRMTDQGIYPIDLNGDVPGGSPFKFEQSILVVQRPRIEDPPLTVDSETTDPAITGPEDALVDKVVNVITADRLWDGAFKAPIDVPKGYALFPDCTTDGYGNLRSFNGGPFNTFHAGIDLSACGNNLNIYAVAPGKVVFTQLLTVRGNYTIIDHGWGIFSGYAHQSEVKVKVGDEVKAGQLIGLIGSTGRVTGPHLHWDMWVNRVQVNPLDWINNNYP